MINVNQSYSGQTKDFNYVRTTDFQNRRTNRQIKEPIKSSVFPLSEMTKKVRTEVENHKSILGNLIGEGDVCIFWGTTGSGKSVFGYQLSECLCKGINFFDVMSSTETEEIPYLKLSNQLTPQKVLYLDLEMSVEQICSRYSTKDKNGNITYYEHHPNFFRIEIDKTQTLKDTDYINVIEEKVIETGSKIVFIDNLTMIGSELSHPDVSRDFMKKILGLRDRHNLTIIMIGHPNKFDIRLKKDITMMKGNMNIGSLVHSVFCISPTLQGQNIRYIIQMKTRFEELLFTDRQVIEMYLEKTENGNIGFHFVGYNKEDHLLKDPEMTLEEMIEKMYEENTSITSPKLRDLLYDTYNSGKSSPDSFEKKCLRYLNKIKNRKNR